MRVPREELILPLHRSSWKAEPPAQQRQLDARLGMHASKYAISAVVFGET